MQKMRKRIINNYKKKKNSIILLACFVAPNIAYSQQVGINTQTPEAALDIVGSGDTEYLPLKLSPISGNIINQVSQVNYDKAAPLYIDQNGYVFKSFHPVETMVIDKRALPITTSWQTLYTLPDAASVVDLAFFTNFAFGAGNKALIYGKMMVGYGTSINIYAFDTTVVKATITGNLTSSASVAFNDSGSDLQFQLTSNNELQVKKSLQITSSSNLFILESTVTSL